MATSAPEKGDTVKDDYTNGNTTVVIDDPLSWPNWKKFYHTAIASFSHSSSIASSIYIPAIPSVQSEFHVSETVSLLAYSLYAFGQALGPVLAAPISETFGRRGTYAPYLFLFMLFSIGVGFSKNITALCICRFFAGVTGSPALGVGLGVIADIWEPKDRAIPMAVIIGVPFLAPSLGPLLGGYLVDAKGWRWTQLFLVFLAIFACLSAVAMKETYRTVLIARQQKRQGDTTSSPDTMAKFRILITSTLFRPWKLFFTEPIIASFALLSGFDTAIYYALFAVFPYIFTSVYGLRLESQGLAFLGLAVGNVLGFVTAVFLSRMSLRRIKKAIQSGRMPNLVPEMRLLPSLVGSAFVPAGLFWIDWSSRKSVHLIVPIMGSAMFAYGNFLVFISYAGYVIDVYKARIGASATSTVAMLRSILAGIFPLFAPQMYDRLGIAWATSVFAFIAAALSTVPWLLRQYGPALRERSKYK